MDVSGVQSQTATAVGFQKEVSGDGDEKAAALQKNRGDSLKQVETKQKAVESPGTAATALEPGAKTRETEETDRPAQVFNHKGEVADGHHKPAVDVRA